MSLALLWLCSPAAGAGAAAAADAAVRSREQLVLIRRTDVLVAPTGSLSLALSLFLPGVSSVIELQPSGKTDLAASLYARAFALWAGHAHSSLAKAQQGGQGVADALRLAVSTAEQRAQLTFTRFGLETQVVLFPLLCLG